MRRGIFRADLDYVLDLDMWVRVIHAGGGVVLPDMRDVAISVNELARQLDELRRAIARAERLSILGRLSGGLAHHLRNDVTGELMAVQMHRRNCHAADQESLDVALRQLRLIEDHLKRFLAAGQPERPRRAVVRPRELVAELVALLMPTAQHRRVELACAVPSAAARWMPIVISCVKR